ncbi:arylamine N-acetyltransferase family protein [Microbulbifer marinus]|uniref:N-hydroxyarylamine O-acetyltransferase n=1 Tax=Microbulbifer marinus TaxID=658218 RepID=A0A1H3W4Q7_9GAMM|nr:arylamine N-acetyltransferase [Microbulbifer marinus]SDZ82109.1 N-hydroxyarylamine O-acetyltransferase [Microbulbifer marinus]
MNTVTIDLDAYLQRVGYSGTPAADLHTVKTIIKLHTRFIPFENLNPFLGWPVDIDLASVERKLVREGRGGYCYEQNALFRAVLQAIGIPVTGLAARVLWQMPAGHQPAQSHMMLCAEIDGTVYLVDVGFGGQTPTAPLRLEDSAAQSTAHGVYRIRNNEGDYLLETKISTNWLPVYSFNMKKQSAGDYKVFNWYCSTHPESRFVNELVAARAFSGGRHTLLGRELTYYPLTGPKTVVRLASPQDLCRTLTDVFDIQIPTGPDVDLAIARLFPVAESRV